MLHTLQCAGSRVRHPQARRLLQGCSEHRQGPRSLPRARKASLGRQLLAEDLLWALCATGLAFPCPLGRFSSAVAFLQLRGEEGSPASVAPSGLVTPAKLLTAARVDGDGRFWPGCGRDPPAEPSGGSQGSAWSVLVVVARLGPAWDWGLGTGAVPPAPGSSCRAQPMRPGGSLGTGCQKPSPVLINPGLPVPPRRCV